MHKPKNNFLLISGSLTIMEKSSGSYDSCRNSDAEGEEDSNKKEGF